MDKRIIKTNSGRKKKTMDFFDIYDFDTEETAKKLLKLAGMEENTENITEIDEALFYLKTAAQNKYNRTIFYSICKVLNAIAENN